MGTIRVPGEVATVVHVFLGKCPICGGSVQDKRYSRKALGFANHIYRASKTSVTTECKSCGLRQTTTWRSLAEAMVKAGENEEKAGKKGSMGFYMGGVERLDHYVDTEYSHRKLPHKRKPLI